MLVANKRSLSSTLVIRPDMSLKEKAIESALLKKHWLLIQAGHNHKQIKN